MIDWIKDKTRRCCTCKQYKPFTDFHKDKRGPEGLAYTCKSCAIERSKFHHHRRMKSDPEYKRKKRDSHMRATWGLSEEEYTRKWQQQKYCAICSALLLGGLQTHLDHDHKTGSLRKFLCTNCNRGLGSFKDNTEYLMNAVNYLNVHSKEGSSL